MIFWQLNTRAPQTVATLKGALERERDHFIRTQHPDTVVQQLQKQLSDAGESGARDIIRKALDSYLSAKPSSDQMQQAERQMNGAIEAAVALGASMIVGLDNALLNVSICGHVDEGRQDGIDQRSAVAIDFAPMPRVVRGAAPPLAAVVEEAPPPAPKRGAK